MDFVQILQAGYWLPLMISYMAFRTNGQLKATAAFNDNFGVYRLICYMALKIKGNIGL